MLLVNGPIMINWPKTKKGIENFQGKKVDMVYGMNDPSYRYFEILKCINSDKLVCTEVEGADHNFTGMEDALKNIMIEFIKSGL